MLSAVLLRDEIEAKLSSRIPGALSPRSQQATRLLSSGNPEIDCLLAGGLPFGAITELAGESSSGRTALAFSVLSQATHEGACALVDVDDSFDPLSAAAAGVTLSRLLWVRVKRDTYVSASQKAVATPALHQRRRTRESVQQNCGRPHPREEVKGLDRAIAAVLSDQAQFHRDKSIGTPAHVNRKLSLAHASEEQIAYDRLQPRRGDSPARHEQEPLRKEDRAATAIAGKKAHASLHTQGKAASKPGTETAWTRLDRALRATDLILQAGGFRLVVLDMGDVAPEHALRIPLATWYRFRRSAHESDCVLLVLSREGCAKSAASCVLACSPERSGTWTERGTVLSGFSHIAEVSRQRQTSHLQADIPKKAPGRVTRWNSTTPWASGKER